MKNLIISLAIIFFTGILFSCEEDLEEYEPQPESQEVEATINYSGFVNYDLGYYNLYVLVWDEDSKEILNYYVGFNHEYLREGGKINFRYEKFPPGKYTTYAWWDLENDGYWHEYDPDTEIVEFTVDGFNKTTFNLYLKDKVTSPNGWIEGTIVCHREDYGPVHLKVRSVDHQEFLRELQLDIDFGSWYKEDYLIEGLEQGLYRIDYFMDINSSGYHDPNEPTGNIGFWVYSALPARVKDITFD
jgi:hypothetical protein